MISLIIGLLLIKMTILYSSIEKILYSGKQYCEVNIKENTKLSFYIKAIANQKIKATIHMKPNAAPFNSITICSYKKLNSSCIDQFNQTVSFKNDRYEL